MNAVMPVIVAGAIGRIAIAYYATEGSYATGDPNGAITATWYVHVASSLDATSPSCRFADARTVAQLVHRGSVCGRGGSCLPPRGDPTRPSDRSLGDLMGATLLPDGRLVVAYAHDDPLPLVLAPTAAVAVQRGGDSLLAPSNGS
jgi:hypothetical protein